MYVPDLCGVYYLEIKYRNEDKRERLYGNFIEGTEDKNTQNIEIQKKEALFIRKSFLFCGYIYLIGSPCKVLYVEDAV